MYILETDKLVMGRQFLKAGNNHALFNNPRADIFKIINSMSSDLTFKLSKIDKQVGKPHFKQIFLFLQCMDLSGQTLDNAKAITDIYQLILDSLHSTKKHLAIPLLQYILQFVRIQDADILGACGDELAKAAKRLAFASLLIRICQRLGSDEYYSFKVSICFGVLECNKDTIESCEDLMGKLFKQKKVTPGNVKLLLDWLPRLGREDLAEKVTEYEKIYKQIQKEKEEEDALSAALGRSLSTQEEAKSAVSGGNQQYTNGDLPAVPTALTIQEMTRKAGITEADLQERVAQPNLYQIANSIGDDWKGLVLPLRLSEQADEASQALTKWRTDRGHEANYLSLVEAFLGLKKIRHAERVFELLKDGVPPGQDETSDETGQVSRYCTGDCFKEEEEEEDLLPTLDDAGWGSVRPSKLWDVASYLELKVHFLNPHVLKDKKKPWQYGRHHNPLTTDLVLSWACTWNTPDQQYPVLPDHDETNPEDAQIKVMFDTRGISESKVGKDALMVTGANPTMILNLYGMSDAAQKSYVIHEFGHALGLDHEHQRSRFWDILEEKDKKGNYRFIVGIDKMKKTNSYGQPACQQHLRKNWPEKEAKITRPEYDPDSIMHYWFDKQWLLTKYRDLGTVRKVSDLSEEQRRVLEGVHARDVSKYDNLLPKGPSNLDYQALKDAYKH